MVTENDIRAALIGIGLTGASLEVHSSLRSFGVVDGGADAVVRALTSLATNVIVPAFQWDAHVAGPPGDQPKQNATPMDGDYRDQSPPPIPFDPATTGVGANMGVISQTVAKWPGAVRSPHPLTSFAAWGRDAKFLAENHPWDQPQFSISQLMKLDGHVLMLGVSFTSLTAVHLAEEMAGRRTFIRWVVDKGMNVKRVRVGGCSDGFDRLMPPVEDLLKRTTVGSCNIISAPLRPLLERMAEVICREPETTACSDRCDRCLAAIAGGPID